ncbi:cytochrome b5-like heme/steroid binding domain-containing protein [Suillus clintonianus]|uniref:cytochrome b5-like heme/steroid binding domain-containing protein n=1 Tax=Suillus clintonianus TaxID=1904413 RepID=UPI001B8813CF|nr:cytochrome b5-like heme/steroid binding domain-containing protein [Suillus clintonianus]KAG2128541.1 cytochrome b5-like heme/steroid binding domain-containing protein [Suillus clintonianus]
MAKVVTYEELKAHSTKDIYDVTKFIDEHPGGDDVILAEAGKDASQIFEDVGHSDEARELLPHFLVGDFEKDGALKISDTKMSGSGGSASSAALKISDTKMSGSGGSASSAVEQGSNLMCFTAVMSSLAIAVETMSKNLSAPLVPPPVSDFARAVEVISEATYMSDDDKLNMTQLFMNNKDEATAFLYLRGENLKANWVQRKLAAIRYMHIN